MATASDKLKASDFIRPPFKPCPRCGQETYGIWMISPDSYSRKCKRCLHPAGGAGEHFPLPPVNKKVVYLDQLVLSEMLKAVNPKTKAYKSGKADPFWQALYLKLAKLCRAQLIVCPKSELHRDESLVSPFPRELKGTYQSLAQGLAFYDRNSIAVLQFVQSARQWFRGKNVAMKALDPQSIIHGRIHEWPPLWRASLDLDHGEDVKAAIRKGRDIGSAALHDEVLPRWQRQQGKTFETIVSEETEGYRRCLLGDGRRYFSSWMIALSGRETPDPGALLFPPVGVQVFSAVLKVFLPSGVWEDKVLEKYSDFLDSSQFGETPFLELSSMLWATIARAFSQGGQKKALGRGIGNDVSMVSHYLPYCDAMFVDNKMREYLRQQPLCDTVTSTNTLIFSPNVRDEFVKYLDEIESNAPATHMQAVHEVFGPL